MLEDRLQKIVEKHGLVRKLLSQRRVPNFYCLGGHCGIEFAMHGRDVDAIGSRKTRIVKWEFAKREGKFE